MDDLLHHLERSLAEQRPEAVCDMGRRLLSGLAAERGRYPAVRHPVGFIHIGLPKLNGQRARLHLWPVPNSEPQQPDWRVHSHQWHLRSYVLLGAVTNVNHNVASDPGGPFRLYEVDYSSGTSILRATETRVACDTAATSYQVSGTTHEVAEDVYHTTLSPEDVWTATIVLEGAPTSDPPRVVGDLEGEPEYRFERELISPAELGELLRSFEARA